MQLHVAQAILDLDQQLLSTRVQYLEKETLEVIKEAKKVVHDQQKQIDINNAVKLLQSAGYSIAQPAQKEVVTTLKR